MSAVVDIGKARQERDVSDEPAMQEGYTRIVNELVESLSMAPLGAGHFRVIFAIIRQTYGWNKTRDRISGGQLASITNMKRQTCNRLVRELITMNLIHQMDGGALRINTISGSWNLDARPRHTRQGIPDTGTTVGSTHGEGPTGTDVRSATGTDVRSATGTDGGTHKRQERQERQIQEKSPLPGACSDGKNSKADPIAYQAIADIYNETMGIDRPQVVKLTKNRRTLIKARWKETFGKSKGSDLNFWRRYFNYARRSKVLCGMKEGMPWAGATFDWLLNEANMAKVIEGNYHNADDIRQDLTEDQS